MIGRTLASLTVCVVAAGFLAGCATYGKKTPPAPAPPVAQQTAAKTAPTPPERVTDWPYSEAPGVPQGYKVHQRIQRVSFTQSSYSLNGEALGALRETVELLRTNPAWHVLTVGMTDKMGEASQSELGRRRADAVKRFLENQGIASSRISAMSVGARYAEGDQYAPTTVASDRRTELWAFMH